MDLEEVSQAIIKHRDRHGLKAEQEVRNYWNALSFLSTSKRLKIQISENFIKRLHSIIEVRGSGRRNEESEYREATRPGVLFAVYDSITGRPEYIPPEAKDVPQLMKEFVNWINSEYARELPTPVRAGIAAYQLLTIHPFYDGNGRTARALATYILSIDGYDLKGFNSMEEYYVSDLQGYYSKLQMDLPVLYYDGRNNPSDLAPWLEYFILTMERAFRKVARIAESKYKQQIDPRVKRLEPRELVVIKLLFGKGGDITPKEIAEEFKVVPRTVTEWAKEWMEKGIIEPASGTERIRAYKLGRQFSDLTLSDLGYADTDHQ
ncbi:Fic family protein [Brevibacillus centrosporus]|uniref:Fic family protein n=1 Tax=Brevibacillus centrosporus TaxID=54910 RepID=UPI00116BBFCC|nr:Fic family protein [Brevibacillus centrosporus]MEC2128947.1 Fic family protein [Brevibacillus centrosporus]MED4910065.1 Fic family protein [Brevibacillus centrosporus]GED33955.1 cell division protein Fic [Brevibacillus centrosporus]